MKSRKSFCAALLAAAVALAFFAGRCSATTEPGVCFHAEILERDGTRFHVNGLDCNDINGRGEFTFSVKEGTTVVWRGTPIKPEYLTVGDRIMVTYSGYVLETYPGQLTDVYRIDLLEDEIKIQEG